MEAIFNSLSYFLWVALALGVLVFVHELGHFLAARLFGMRVDAFSLGFPPNLLYKKVGQTEYRLGAIPLGGYVKIAGMVDESMDAEGLESDPEPDEFRSKPVWQRSIVISAGVIFNLVFAVILFAALALAYGRSYTPAENVPLEIAEGSVAAEMGLQSGDRVVAVNGERIERFEEVFTPESLAGDPFELTVLRADGEAVLTGPEGLASQLSRLSTEVERAGDDASLESVFGISLRLPPVLASVSAGSAADEAGLQAGDRILSIGGQPTVSWDRLTEQVQASGGQPVEVVWARPDSLGAARPPARLVERRGAANVYAAEIAPRASGETYQLGVLLDATAIGQRTEFGGQLGFRLVIGQRIVFCQGRFVFRHRRCRESGGKVAQITTHARKVHVKSQNLPVRKITPLQIQRPAQLERNRGRVIQLSLRVDHAKIDVRLAWFNRFKQVLFDIDDLFRIGRQFDLLVMNLVLADG